MRINDIRYLPATNAVADAYSRATGVPFIGEIMAAAAGQGGESPEPGPGPEPPVEEFALTSVVIRPFYNGSFNYGIFATSNIPAPSGAASIHITGTASDELDTRTIFEVDLEPGENGYDWVQTGDVKGFDNPPTPYDRAEYTAVCSWLDEPLTGNWTEGTAMLPVQNGITGIELNEISEYGTGKGYVYVSDELLDIMRHYLLYEGAGSDWFNFNIDFTDDGGGQFTITVGEQVTAQRVAFDEYIMGERMGDSGTASCSEVMNDNSVLLTSFENLPWSLNK